MMQSLTGPVQKASKAKARVAPYKERPDRVCENCALEAKAGLLVMTLCSVAGTCPLEYTS